MTNEPNLDNAMYGAIRETAVIPRQPINMKPMDIIAGVQIRQVQVADQQLTRIQTPLNTQRISIGGNLSRIAVQFFRDPFDPTYAGTSVYVKSVNGISSLQGNAGEGPISFVSTATSGPASIAISTNGTSGTSTSTDFGTGTSEAINRL